MNQAREHDVTRKKKSRETSNETKTPSNRSESQDSGGVIDSRARVERSRRILGGATNESDHSTRSVDQILLHA